MDISENKHVMANNIKRYMKQKGVTNQQLCDAIDVKYTTFMDWIKGVTYPRIGRIEAMANYFGCEKSDLIEDHLKRNADTERTSKEKKALIDFIQSVPDDKAEMILKVIQSIVEFD